MGAVDDFASIGNYPIYSCASRAPAVKDLLGFTYKNLKTALESTDSSAYKASSAPPKPPPYAASCRQSPPAGKVTTSDHGSMLPIIVCANDRDLSIKKFWRQC